MRIGVMLRHLDQHGGGVLTYTRNLLPELLRAGTEHDFVFLYRDARFVGAFGTSPHLREEVLEAPTRLLWDQVAVPLAARRLDLDLVFNPKYSVPVVSPCPTVFVCHGLDWYVAPRWSRMSDRVSHRFLVPRYARSAERIIAVSNTTRDHVQQFLGVPGERVVTIYLGLGEQFRRPPSPDLLGAIKERYALPDEFLLYVGQIYPPKNFGRLLRAYAETGPELGLPLVVAGEHRWLCEEDLQLVDELGIRRWLLRPGWIEHEELPALYQLASALLLPSLYEACPSPPLEAMASGCPVLTSDRYGTREISGGAAVLVDPESVESIADGIRRVVGDEALRRRLVEAGRRRAAEFTWPRCASATLTVLEAATRDVAAVA